MHRQRLIGIVALAAAAVLASAAGSGRTSDMGIPCSKLARLHKTLPPRCRKKKPPKPESPPLLGTVAARITFPDETGGDQDDMVYGEGALWVLDSHGLLRIDPATNAVVARVSGVIGTYGGIAVTPGAVWIDAYGKGEVYRVDPSTNQIVASVEVPDAPEGLTATPGAVWVATHYGQSVTRIDPATNKVVANIHVGHHDPGDCCGPQRITAGAGSVWVGVPNIESVVRIDPATSAVVATIRANGSCGDLAADESSVWVTNSSCTGSGVVRIDPTTNSVVPTPRLGDIWIATGVTMINGSVYIGVNRSLQGIERIDPATNAVTGVLPISGLPASGDAGHLTLVFAAGSLWVRGRGEVVRVQLTG